MSGSESYMLNAAVSDVQQSQSQNSVPLAYTAADGTPVYTPPPISTALYAAPPPMDMTPPPPYSTAVYAPPMDMVPPHPKSPSPTPVTYQPDTGASGGSDVAEAVVQPSVKNNNGNNNTGEGTKRRRGRPRKYPPSTEGFTAAPTAPAAPAAMGRVYLGKKRGRPAGSSKKQRAAPAAVSATGQVASGLTGAGLTAYVVTVEAGEDVLAKLMSFSQRNTQAVCVLSANGTISNVTLERAATCGGTVTIEGRFEILSLSGSFLLSEYGGQRSRTGGLSVSLAGPDGRVLGGGVAGLLMAASPVRVIVGSFAAGGQQQPTNPVGSPPSRATISGSSGGPGSPLNHSTGGYNSIPQTTGDVAWNAPSY